MFKAILVGAAALALAATGASATTVLFDDFSGEGGGANILNYNGFANFDVTGQVDLVQSVNGFGIVTPKAVVDLDGTPGPGLITTKLAYAFGIGEVVTLTLNVGGAQRGSISDVLDAGIVFGGLTNVLNLTFGGGFPPSGPFNLPGAGSVLTFIAVPGVSAFQDYTISFTAGNAGTLTAFVGSNSTDNVGPLLSTFTLDIAAVPEPATWGLLITGFGMVGSALRRRRTALAA